jgi:hypothetical protein
MQRFHTLVQFLTRGSRSRVLRWTRNVREPFQPSPMSREFASERHLSVTCVRQRRGSVEGVEVVKSSCRSGSGKIRVRTLAWIRSSISRCSHECHDQEIFHDHLCSFSTHRISTSLQHRQPKVDWYWYTATSPRPSAEMWRSLQPWKPRFGPAYYFRSHARQHQRQQISAQTTSKTSFVLYTSHPGMKYGIQHG